MDRELIDKVTKAMWNHSYPNITYEDALKEGAPSASASRIAFIWRLAEVAIEAVRSYKHSYAGGDMGEGSAAKPLTPAHSTQNTEIKNPPCQAMGEYD